MNRYHFCSLRSIRSAKFLVSAALCATSLLPGCKAGENVAADLPKQGEMRVISVEPLSQGPSDLDNLVPNGNFSEWWAGAPAPTNFMLPPASFSRVERVASGLEHFTCIQSWSKVDRKAGGNNRLSVSVPNIKPETIYEFSVYASSIEGGTATFDVYETTEIEKPQSVLLLGEPVIPAEATEPTWYSARFETKLGGILFIYSGTVDENVPKGKVAWSTWHLREVGPGTTAKQATLIHGAAAPPIEKSGECS